LVPSTTILCDAAITRIRVSFQKYVHVHTVHVRYFTVRVYASSYVLIKHLATRPFSTPFGARSFSRCSYYNLELQLFECACVSFLTLCVITSRPTISSRLSYPLITFLRFGYLLTTVCSAVTRNSGAPGQISKVPFRSLPPPSCPSLPFPRPPYSRPFFPFPPPFPPPYDG